MTHQLRPGIPRLAFLVMVCFLFATSCSTGPDSQESESYDFIASFDEANGDLGRLVIPIHFRSTLLESGFRRSPGSTHVLVSAPKAVLRFDSPWTCSDSHIDMILRASRPGRIRIILNDHTLGETSVGTTDKLHSWEISTGLLQPQANHLTLQKLDADGLVLSAVTLPPTDRTIQIKSRRAQLLPGPPPTNLDYKVRIPGSLQLTCETAYSFPAATAPKGMLVFEIEARSEGIPEILFSREVSLGPGHPVRAAEPAVVDLDSLAGKEVELTFRTTFHGDQHLPLTGKVGWIRPHIRSAEMPDSSKPSLIIWLVDTQRADHMGCYGFQRSTTPHIESFSRDAIQFENMFSNSSWTKASIATFFTGLHPSAHGAVGRNDRLLPQVTTLAQVIRNAGYRTTAFSANTVFHAEDWDICRGFEEVFTYPIDKGGEGRQTMALLSDLDPWLEKVGKVPFFLFILTLDPHAPYHPPTEYSAMFSEDYQGPMDRRVDARRRLGENLKTRSVTEVEKRQVEALYDSEIAFADHCFGRFIALLKKQGLLDTSYVLCLSDHGEELNDHQNWGHGQSLHDELIRLPLFARLPGGQRSGSVLSRSVQGIDLMPTVLEWLSVDGPKGQGTSFAAAVEPENHSSVVEILAEQALDRNRLYSLTQNRYKYILRLSPYQQEALYDIRTDPAEQQNLFASHQAIAAPMAVRVTAFRDMAERGTRIMFVNPNQTMARGEIVARSPITLVRGINLNRHEGVVYGLSQDRHRLWFNFNVGSQPRGFVFDLERPDLGATLQLETHPEGEVWPVYIGQKNERIHSIPVELKGPDLLSGRSNMIDPSDKEFGCFIWRLPGGQDMGPDKLSAEETENLRHLGYIE